MPKHDLYGSLFMHLRDRLRRFTSQLTRHRITLRLRCMDACQLASSLPHKVQFDRIDLSNIVDKGMGGQPYPGLKRAIAPWAPHLKPTGVIIAYFLNWTIVEEFRASLYHRLEEARMQAFRAGGGGGREAFVQAMSQAAEFSAVDTCPEFREYLRQEGAAAMLRGLGLCVREKHEVVPPRFGVPVGAAWDAVPMHMGLESDPVQHYGLTRLPTGIMLSERFIEVVHQD